VSGSAKWVMWALTAASLCFLTAPFLFVALSSFGSGEVVVFPPHDLTTKWYTSVRPEFLQSFLTSLLLAVVSALGAVVLGIPAAIALVRGSLAAKPFVQALLRAPLQVPQLVIGVALLQFYRMSEDITDMQITGTMGGLICAHVSFTLPYAIAAISAAFANANPHLEEAAYSLGASQWSTLRRVILPVIRPGINAALFFAFITSFENVPVSLFLVGSGVVTLPIMIFEEVQFAFGPSIMAVSTIIVVASILLILAVQRLLGVSIAPWQSH
jgi:putative spermidine/putrescine transport system permease protein